MLERSQWHFMYYPALAVELWIPMQLPHNAVDLNSRLSFSLNVGMIARGLGSLSYRGLCSGQKLDVISQETAGKLQLKQTSFKISDSSPGCGGARL